MKSKRGLTVLNSIVMILVLVGSMIALNFIGGIFSEDITGGAVENLEDGTYRVPRYNVVNIGDWALSMRMITPKYVGVNVLKGNELIRGKRIGLGQTISVYGFDITYIKGNNCRTSCPSADLRIIPTSTTPTISPKEIEEVTESQVPAGATLILGERTDTKWTLNIGDTLVAEGKKVTLGFVDTFGGITIIVDGFKEYIPAKETETVNGLVVTNIEPFYTSVPPKVTEIPKEIPAVSCTREAIDGPWKVDRISGDDVCKAVGKKCSIAALLIIGVSGDRYLTLRGCSEIQYLPNNNMLGWIEAICC